MRLAQVFFLHQLRPTSDADRAPVSRPMSPLEMDRNGELWLFTDWRSVKVEHLGVVNLSFIDPARATHVSLSGRGEISHGLRAHRALVDAIRQALVS